MLHVEEELVFKRGKINMIIGPTGSGKTSLLMALLGECDVLFAGGLVSIVDFDYRCVVQVKCTS